MKPQHHSTTAPQHHSTTAPQHHSTTAPQHHSTTAPNYVNLVWIFILLFFFLLALKTYGQQRTEFMEQWSEYKGEQQFYLKAKSITDAAKNVYIAGATLNDQGNYDLLVTKYDRAGNEIWSNTFNGSFAGNDYPLDLQLDPQNNLYVTGGSQNGLDIENGYELILLKYNNTGNFVWSRSYDSSQNGPDMGTAIKYADGYIYIAGATASNGTLDYYFAKYSPSGQLIWSNTYDYQNLYDGALKIDVFGTTVVVSGISQVYVGEIKWEIATLRVSSDDGQILDTKRTGGSGEGLSNLSDLQIDANGNIYLCGSIDNSNSGLDFKTAKLDEDLNIEWVQEYNCPDNGDDEAMALTLDSYGNVYVVGTVSDADHGKDILTIKYSPTGSIIWTKQYNGEYNGDDEAVGIELTNDGDVIVAATSFKISNSDYLLLRYGSSNGSLLNRITYNGEYNGDDIALGLAIDDDGAILVVGQSQVGNRYRYNTVKYRIENFIDPFFAESLPSANYMEPNNGQLQNTTGQAEPDVAFINERDYPRSYIQKNKISYVVERADASTREKIHASHTDTTINWNVTDSLLRVDMVFQGAGAGRIQPFDEKRFYKNYFLSYFDAKRIQTYQKLIKFDLWREVDLVLANAQFGLDLSLTCNPGFKESSLQWSYQGADSVAVLQNDTICIYTPFGNLTYALQEAYQINSSGQQVLLGWTPDYQINNGIVSLALGTYNPALPLIIRQSKAQGGGAGGGGSNGNLDWSTFYGGSQQEILNDVATDKFGNAIVTGSTKSDNFPVTTGAFQYQHVLNLDIQLVKFNENTLTNEWATYYGGSGADRGYGIAADSDGDIVAVGFSGSSDFPIENELQTNSSSGRAALLKLDESGAIRYWASQYGPLYDFAVSEDLAVDNNDNVYIVGHTAESLPVVSQSGTTSYATGGGFILKLSPGGSPLWATNFGHGACRVNGVTTDNAGNVYLAGSSRSGDPIIGYNPNYTSFYGGSFSDAFIAKLGSDDNVEWGSWIGGNNLDEAEEIAVSDNGKVCIVGGTTSNTGFALLNALPNNTSYGGDDGQTPIGGTDHHGDGFITEFASNGSLLFSTYFGGAQRDACLSVKYDAYGQIYVSGYSGSSNGTWLTSTQGSISGLFHQNNFAGLGDAFIAALNPGRDLVWGTYFGGTYAEIAYGLAINNNDEMYVAGWTESSGLDDPPYFPLKDPSGTQDYFQDMLNLNSLGQGDIGDGFIARFNLFPITSLVSVSEMSNNKSLLTIFPNPNHGEFRISDNLINEGITDIRIYSLDGRNVYQSRPTLSENIEISVPDLTVGVYMLVIQTDENSYSGKFVKQ